jgi:VIT1/CCC1 family predicted Fe2+/Mn2+ transporter
VKRRSHHPSLERTGWIRAAVLGANDGIVSTASLVLGVASASASKHEVLVAGLAGLAAGALSMAVGEYVSVSSQRDGEQAELRKEKRELRVAPRAERKELADIYVERGLDRELARQVAVALMAKDPLAAHARDELRIDPENLANPIQAAIVSLVSFALGAGIPLVVIVLAPAEARLWATLAASLVTLGMLGGWSARLSGAPIPRVVARVLVGGALAMGITAGIGALVGGALPS